MKTILVATNNPGKVAEIRNRLERLDFSVLSLGDIEEKIHIVEDADTFELNAVKKAQETCLKTGQATLADDSGLEVDALNGKPGVYSARYGGPHLDDRGRYELLLEELSGIPRAERSARFRAALAYCPSPIDPPTVFHGTLEGWISFEAAGNHGFGYDPVFVPNDYDQTLALLGPEVKNRISHRASALNQFIAWLTKV